jgi:hypothetical protein
MIEDFAEEFLTALSGDRGFGLPSPRRRGTGALLAPITTTPWMENSPATQATMMVPPWTLIIGSSRPKPVLKNPLHVLPRREPTLKVESILMVDFASTEAQAKEVAPPASREGGQAEVAKA